jgi:hypothetical protein
VEEGFRLEGAFLEWKRVEIRGVNACSLGGLAFSSFRVFHFSFLCKGFERLCVVLVEENVQG